MPFTWPRLGTGTAASKQRDDPAHGAALAALYGNNKEWQAQYAEWHKQYSEWQRVAAWSAYYASQAAAAAEAAASDD